MSKDALYPAVVTLSRPETVFSDAHLVRLVEEAMGAEMGDFLQERLRRCKDGKQLVKTSRNLHGVIEALEDVANELEGCCDELDM